MTDFFRPQISPAQAYPDDSELRMRREYRTGPLLRGIVDMETLKLEATVTSAVIGSSHVMLDVRYGTELHRMTLNLCENAVKEALNFLGWTPPRTEAVSPEYGA